MRVSCPGTAVNTGAQGEALCVDSLGAPVAWEVQLEFDVSQLDTAQMGQAFAAGFAVVATCWCIGFGFRTVLQAFRRF